MCLTTLAKILGVVFESVGFHSPIVESFLRSQTIREIVKVDQIVSTDADSLNTASCVNSIEIKKGGGARTENSIDGIDGSGDVLNALLECRDCSFVAFDPLSDLSLI